MPLTTGQVLNNRYRIVKLLGQGGFGAVYRAWDMNIKVPCAVKENYETSDEAVRQFEREARMLRTLRHRNLPGVTDYFYLPEQGQYLVMDFVEGDDLQDMLDHAGGPLPEARVVEWMTQICDALTHLHSQTPPIIHRDIKPANIKITPQGQAVLVDFGIAKMYDPQMKTTVGARAVTPGFSPPEQYGRSVTDLRTDVYSLGATFYILLTGKEPIESVQRSMGKTLPAPRAVNPSLHPAVEQAILKAMELPPENRFQTIAEFKQALENGMKVAPTLHTVQPVGIEIQQPVAGALPVRPRPARWTWALAALGTLVVLAALAAGGSYIVFPKLFVAPTPTILVLATSTRRPSPTATATPTSSPTPSLTPRIAATGIQPTATPIPVTSTPAGLPTAPITLDNAVHVTQVARWEVELVGRVAVSPDGQTAAAGAADNLVHVYRISDGKLLQTLAGNSWAISAVVFSADGTMIASGSWDDSVQVWRVADGENLLSLRGHTADVWSVAFSPDGKILASASGDETIRLWSIPDGTLIRELKGHYATVWSLAFSPDGKLLASGGDDNTVRFWRVSTGQMVASVDEHYLGVASVAFSPDGEILASGSADTTICLWHVADHTLLRCLPGHDDWVTSVAFSPDGLLLASGSYDNNLRLWRVSDGELLQTLPGHESDVWSVVFSPDGTLLVSGSMDGTIRLWGVR